ncbi:MAG TPA: amidophosphoribosyltransferase, partial [Flavobacteriales bacterium]|nr:amidophosphoribosyltransferase [Flavobacteriales bacterium]
AFNVSIEKVQELPPGHAIIIKKNGDVNISEVREPLERKACSFERIYFSRGSDRDIYSERKDLGKRVVPKILEAIDFDLRNSVFSFIPNTAETSFLGMVEGLESYLDEIKLQKIKELPTGSSDADLMNILEIKPRVEKLAIKDAKLRTFITQDDGRDELVEHVYDIT